MIALFLVARRIAEALGVDTNAPLTQVCQSLGANRTYVYEQADRILALLEGLASSRPGRPSAPDKTTDDDPASLQLTLKVYEFQIHHPGSVVPQRGRYFYSPAFQRFILSLHDQWIGTREAFADAAHIPLDTLTDWIQRDRRGLISQQDNKKTPLIPRNAAQLVRDIAIEWQRWQGPTKPFFGHAARLFGLSTAQVNRVLLIIGAISRRPRIPFRFRGETRVLAPGTMLVTDGKTVNIHLTGSDQILHLNWQGMVDQTTGCDTAVVVSSEECAAAVAEAFRQSIATLGGLVPDALLHDGKPCYSDAKLVQLIQGHYETIMIKASPARGQNKAIQEGSFGLFEQRFGLISLDDSSFDSLISSAVREILRAYTAATNSVPRIELDGKSRLSFLNHYCPSLLQRQRDLDFIAKLKADHDTLLRKHPDPSSRFLLDTVFDRLGILDKDPDGTLRKYLASFHNAAIRRAAALVSNKLHAGSLDPRYIHRYLTKIVRSSQSQLDLERAADELLALCQAQHYAWTSNDERDLELLSSSLNPLDLACAIAENAAHGAIPLSASFWKSKLLDLLRNVPHLINHVKKHISRLFEAPVDIRLALLDSISALQVGLL